MIGIDKAGVSREMRKMEQKGDVRVSDDPTNLRRKFLELTAKGYALQSLITDFLERVGARADASARTVLRVAQTRARPESLFRTLHRG